MKSAILVVGDSMLDCYWDTAVERISPEAPVPVARKTGEWFRAGGAANVAVNLASMGCGSMLVSPMGQDDSGDRLARLLASAGVAVESRVKAPTTTQKIRVVCRRQQLMRVDIEEQATEDAARQVADAVRDLRHPLVLLSDYDKGALRYCQDIIRAANARGAQVLVDPKADYTRYRGALLLKPNAAEAARMMSGTAPDSEGFDASVQGVMRSLEIRYMLVTRGDAGMTLYKADQAPLRIAAEAREVYDVSGAGDTVLAALGCALARGDGIDDAVRFANRAAGIVVGKFGTAAVTLEELA
jgi:rfaE bifunctional protein kinase chain/domain